jgi:N utilization substance protein B
MERLRREFVLRGSRTASGSTSEQICLEVVTGELREWLPSISASAIRAAPVAANRLLAEAPYWQELRLEKAFRTAAPGVALVPPRLLSPHPIHAERLDLADSVQGDFAALNGYEMVRLHAFVERVREALPGLLELEMRQQARAFARELAAAHPLGSDAQTVQVHLRERREAYNRVQQDRWRKIAGIVQQQTADWLRTASFAVRLVRGVEAQQQEIDLAIEGLSAGWRLERQVAVDRNILRLAGFEMLFLPNVPTGATINEAVELAKKYSTTESGRFVNGVLGALATLAGEKASETSEMEEQEDVLDLPDISDIEEME